MDFLRGDYLVINPTILIALVINLLQQFKSLYLSNIKSGRETACPSCPIVMAIVFGLVYAEFVTQGFTVETQSFKKLFSIAIATGTNLQTSQIFQSFFKFNWF